MLILCFLLSASVKTRVNKAIENIKKITDLDTLYRDIRTNIEYITHTYVHVQVYIMSMYV